MAILLQGASQTVTVAGTVQAALNPQGGAYASRSGVIAAGGVSQQLAAANAARKALFVHNPVTATEPIGVNPMGGAAAIGGADTITLPAGATYVWDIDGMMPTSQINVVAATINHQYVAGEM